MSRTFRIGVQIAAADPFWVQVREAVYQAAQQPEVDFFPLDVIDPYALSADEHLGFVEELLAQEIDALISLDLPESLAQRALHLGIPVINLVESDLRHPLFVSPYGLYDIAREISLFLAQKLAGRGRLLVVGGLMFHRGEDGRSRLSGVADALRSYPALAWRHLPSLWTYESAAEQIRQTAWPDGEHFDALFGFSDSLALGGRDAGRALGLLDERALVAGINGDPLALAAILEGSMTATVQTSPTDIGRQAVDLACRAARKQPLPPHFSYKPLFVTAENVGEVAVQKLAAIARLPSLLIGDSRRQAQARLAQLETGLKINQQVGAQLDRQRLLREIANLIRVSYGYDVVQAFLWDEATRILTRPEADGASRQQRIPLDDAGLLAEALSRSQAVFIPDTHHSHRFSVDPAWPETRSRVIVPIRLGDETLGLLDLHSRVPRQHARQDLIGLQSLADQLGIALRNAELYHAAVAARADAEKADQIKTRLLANVSHELRTPLNVVLGYASAALATPNPYQAELPAALRRDLQQIFNSGEHLLRLINDLLDLSRAEINALDLFPELIEPRRFLEEAFHSLADSLPAKREVAWRLELPERLPAIQADPVRLRQILLNLLSNAYKFTASGEIVLGAEAAPPHLHIWVRDSGLGIPPALQEKIFEPFVTSQQDRRPDQGVGLGLTITRRLVLLHGGSLSVDSQPGRGSVFHVHLPLPGPGAPTPTPAEDARPALVVIGADDPPPASIIEFGQRQGWAIRRLQPQADLAAALTALRPAALAWDLTGAGLEDWSLIQKIRAMPHLAQLPFILYDAGQPAALVPGLGLTDFLVKPFGQETLVDTLSAMRPATGPGQVLIVDDDPQTRDLYARLVAEALPGYALRVAEDGQAALDQLAQSTPALVILDLMMPGVDGFTVLEKLRTNPATRQVPVVVLSGRALSLDDVRRLDQMYVTFHSKGLLSEAETATALQQALAGVEALPQPTSLAVKQAIAYLQHNHRRAISRQELAAAVGVSKDYLSHIFKQELGLSPWEYLTRYRVQQAKTLLSGTPASVTAIALQVGFDDLSYFNRVFRKHAGCSPTTYRERAAQR